MTVDLNSYTFWIVGIIWFTVPIMSWAWSVGSIHYYRKLTKLITDTTKAFEQAKALNEQMLSYRLETLEIRSKAEEEIKLACTYYSKISELVAAKEKEKANG
jgi:hypothetical protein